MLTGCAVYTRSKDVRLPGPLSPYVVSGRMSIGLLYREITIGVNGKDVLAGRGYFWSHEIQLSGDAEGVPIEAECDIDANTCAILIAGLRLPVLHFD